MLRRPAFLSLALLVLIAPWAILGCRDNNPSRPRTGPTLQTLWPNDDGRYWNYAMAGRRWTDTIGQQVYSTEDSVPPAPSMTALAEIYRTHPIGSGATSSAASLTLVFDGDTTTRSGVTAQNLRDIYGPPVAAAGITSRPGGFLAQLWRARPDLRPRLASRFGISSAEGGGAHDALFLRGYAWRKTTQWIGTYGDLDTLLAWKFLTSGLANRSEFTHQLVPGLADDVYLHARILRRHTVTVPGGTFANAIECLYMVDFGISGFSDPSGNPIGFGRWITWGTIDYADGVGPVASTQRDLVSVGERLSNGVGDLTVSLVARSTSILGSLGP